MTPQQRYERIEAALERLRDTDFERPACAYPQLKFPDWFPVALVPHGRDGRRLVNKWPDGYSRGEDCVVEACNEQDRAALRRHLLDKDLPGVKKRQWIKRFIFVAGRANLDIDDVKDFTDLFATEGVTARFVTKSELIEDLTTEPYHRVRRMLGCEDQPLPFHYLDDADDLFASEETTADIRPRLSEFYETPEKPPAAFVSPAVDLALHQLKTRGIAYVRGEPASGKTAVAIHVGLRHEAETAQPTYYANLANAAQSHEAKAAGFRMFEEHGVSGSLFILDNIQSDMRFVAGVVSRWRKIGRERGVDLLLLGQPPLDDDVEERLPEDPLEVCVPIDVIVGAADIHGIYRRLALRLDPETEPREPTRREIDSWRNLQADLVTLSFALDQRLHDPNEDDLLIAENHAVEAVRSRYLDGRSGDEREALLDVASVGVLDLGPPETLVAPNRLRRAKKNGAVHQIWHGRTALSKTVHTYYAQLLLKAAGPQQALLDEDRLLGLCKRSPELTWPVVRRVEASELEDEETRRDLCAQLVKQVHEVTPIVLPRNFGLIVDALERLQGAGALSPAQVEQLAFSRLRRLENAVMEADISIVEPAVERLAERFPAVARQVLGLLTERRFAQAIIRASATGGRRTLSAFLASREETRVRRLVLSWLKDEKIALPIAAEATRFAELGPLLAALVDDDSANAAVNIAMGALTPLLASSPREAVLDVGRVARVMPTLEPTLVAAAGGAAAAVGVGVDVDVATLDRLIASGSAPLVSALLADEPTVTRLGHAVTSAEPIALTRLLRRAPHEIRRAIVDAIPTDVWAAAHEANPLPPSEWYGLARCLRDGRRKELSRIAAVASLRAADEAAWRRVLKYKDPMSVVGFAAITVAADADGVALVERLLTTHWKASYLEEAHRHTRAQGLAATMLAVFEAAVPEPVREALSGDALRKKVEPVLADFGQLHGHALERAVGLFGVASLLLRDLEPPRAAPPAPVIMAMIENLRMTEPPRLTYRLAATWIGIRRLRESGVTTFAIPPVGFEVLELWRRAVPPGARHEKVKSDMVSWLATELNRDLPPNVRELRPAEEESA